MRAMQSPDNLIRYKREMMSLPFKGVDIRSSEIHHDPENKEVTVPVMVTYPAKEFFELH